MHSIIIVGCGSIGERHLRCFLKTGRVRVTACDTDPELLQRVAAEYQVPVNSNWEEALVQGGFDAAVVCTPAHLHVPMALRAMECGLHTLIEKPLSQSYQGVNDLIGLRNRTGLQAAVAYVLHVHPLLAGARIFLRSGELGPVRHVTANSGQYFPGGRPAHAVHYSQTYYRDRRTGGGAVQDVLTHTVNWVESVVGPADSVLCDCAHQVLEGVTVEDTVNVCARHGEVLAAYALNQFQAPNESTLQFHTATGSVKIELHRARWGIHRLGDRQWTWRELPPVERDAHFLAQANHFLDQIEGRSSPLCSLEAAAQTLRFNLAALASAETGSRIRCADIGRETPGASPGGDVASHSPSHD